jgi:biotin carboxylase
MTRRVLLLATTTGYQTRAFGDAAERLGVELTFATDRCRGLEDPWQDHAIPIRFYDEAAAVAEIIKSAGARPIDGVVVVGDRPTVVGARVCEALRLPGHSPEAAAIAKNKQRTRERLQGAGLPTAAFVSTTIDADPAGMARSLRYPVVVKPVALSGSRGVMRADDPEGFIVAFNRLRTLLSAPDVRVDRSSADNVVLIEDFIPGREFALEGLMHRGALHVLALFDKPDPLDGPFFEETIYVTPSIALSREQTAIVETIARAAEAIGLTDGPIHAECRLNLSAAPLQESVFVLEVAARPIGGLCARALRFRSRETAGAEPISLEELLLRHALGESPAAWIREDLASGVMMIPIPQRGVFRHADGLEEARNVAGIDEIRVTAKADQLLVPLPEGASYLGFIFAHGNRPGEVDVALRAAHRRLRFTIDPEVPVLRYNQSHG